VLHAIPLPVQDSIRSFDHHSCGDPVFCNCADDINLLCQCNCHVAHCVQAAGLFCVSNAVIVFVCLITPLIIIIIIIIRKGPLSPHNAIGFLPLAPRPVRAAPSAALTHTPLLGRLAFAGRVCAAECCSTPRRCVGSTPMRFWSGCWAPPGIGALGITHR
jgi:hypothetical protein